MPPSYIDKTDCLPTDKSHLSYKFKELCNGGRDLKWFYGFKGTGKLEIQGEFFDYKSGFSFSLAKAPSDYNIVGFPFKDNDDFIDERVHDYRWDV